MSTSDVITVSITNEKIFTEDESQIITADESYSLKCESTFPAVIIFDKSTNINNNLFICSVICELRKTDLDDKLWCWKDSSVFNHYKCHYNTLAYILGSKCVLLFLLNHISLKSLEFINYLKAIKKRMETKQFKLISLIDADLKFIKKDSCSGLTDDLFDFIKTEILNKGYNVDLSADIIEESLSVVANVLPKIVTHLYTPHQFASIDLQQFYQHLKPSDTHDLEYLTTPMYLWNSSNLCDWLENKGYPKKIVEELENKGINGWIIQNVTSEDLLTVLPTCSLVIRNKLIFDVYQFLNKMDVENKNWQITSRKVNVQLKEVYIINDTKDIILVDNFVTNMKLQDKPKVMYNCSYSKVSESCDKLKKDAQRIAKCKIIIVFVTKNSFVNGFSSFKKSICKKIIFSLWIKRSVIFVLWDSDLKVNDLAFKILIDNLPVVDFRSNTLEYNCKLLAELFGIAIKRKTQNQSNEMINIFENNHISTLSDLSDGRSNIDLSTLKNQIKKKIVLHYHTESQRKIKILQKLLETNQYFVELIDVNRERLNNTHYELERNKREETVIEADTILTCLSKNYVESKTTKDDLRFICHILRKNVIVIIIEHISDMKVWHKIKNSLYSTPKFTLSKCQKPFKDIPIIDLSNDGSCTTFLQGFKGVL